jgi:tight adherence protein C
MTVPDLFSGQGGVAISLLIGLGNFITILAVVRALSPRDLVTARAKNHARRRQELKTARLSPRRRSRAGSVDLMRRIVGRLKLDSGKEARTAADRLAQAGYRSRDATAVFLGARLACPMLCGLLAYMAAPSLLADLKPATQLLIAIGGLATGACLPSLMLTNLIQRRTQKIQKGLPDALDLFVICAEAGLSLDATITRVAREMGGSAPELADELGLTAIELGFLPNRRDALDNLAQRVATPSARALLNTLVQTEKYGTPLAQALRVLSAEFRDARMMKAEEKAARLPATLTVPMILFVLPPLFVVLIGPAIIQVMNSNVF